MATVPEDEGGTLMQPQPPEPSRPGEAYRMPECREASASCTAPEPGTGDAALPGALDLATLPLLEVNPDWQSYVTLKEKRCRVWSCAASPEIRIPFFEAPLADGAIGCTVWKSAAALAEHLFAHDNGLLAGREAVLDVGCGCGFAGAAVAVAMGPSLQRLAFADFWRLSLEVARLTGSAALRARGAPEGTVRVDTLGLDWTEAPETWEGEPHAFDVVVASDANSTGLCHEAGLGQVFDRYARREGAVVLDINPETRKGIEDFRRLMTELHGFRRDPEHCFWRDFAAAPPVPGIPCGARGAFLDVYRR